MASPKKTQSEIKKELLNVSATGKTVGDAETDNSGFPQAAMFESSTNESFLKKSSKQKSTPSIIPKTRQNLLKWNGWGYRDSQFTVQDNMIYFTGNRYPIGEIRLPFMAQWVKDVFDVDFLSGKPPNSPPREEDYPAPVLNQAFMAELRSDLTTSTNGLDRLVRSHGHTLQDVYELRQGRLPLRMPDVIIWPESHEDVVHVVQLAAKHNVVIIPFGGGTSVSRAVCCPPDEHRTIVSLDTSQMNQLLWLDKENLVTCCQAGIVGQDLERELAKHGFTTGHEPDSQEFSSLGGWVATRASGMKKNVYGNIEDLVVHVRMVTPTGVLERNGQVPRISCGPDFNHVILGSEGTLGVITEVVLKIRPLPTCKKYGSIVFPNFEAGVKCLREVAKKRCQPASIRLVDNEQFKFGQMLRSEPSTFGSIVDNFKRFYITRWKGFDVHQMCVATLVFEGDKSDVEIQEKKIYEIAGQFGGLPAGEKNGERGYMLTFVIAYIRDLGIGFNVVAESFETSVPWDRTLSLCYNVKRRVAEECKVRGITHYLMSCRVTQTYDAGSCVYFYFAFQSRNIADPVHTYEEIETAAREEILSSGGSISHHHGVGKIRQRWYESQVSSVGVNILRAVKQKLDPANVFACGNIDRNQHLKLKSSL